MPNSFDEFQDLKQQISQILFGNKPDKILDGINTFMFHLDNVRIVLDENKMPKLIMNLLFLPLFFIVMLLNCIKEAIMWWITAIILFALAMAIVGALVTVCFTGYKCYGIYTARFDENGMPKNPDEEKSEEDKEGGS